MQKKQYEMGQYKTSAKTEKIKSAQKYIQNKKLKASQYEIKASKNEINQKFYTTKL